MIRPDSESFASTTPGTDDRIDPPGGWAAMPSSAPDPAEEGTPPMRGDVPPMHAPDFVMRTPKDLSRFDAWNYSDDSGVGDGADLIGYDVEAIDGHIGTIDEASTQVDDAYLVVDTGHWIFGKKVVLPAGTVRTVDALDRKVYVDRTKNQIKEAPPLDAQTQRDRKHRNQVADYYGTSYSGMPVRIGPTESAPAPEPDTYTGPDR